MNFLIVEGDFPFWRGFVFEEWKRLPRRTLLLTQMPQLWRIGDFTLSDNMPLHGGRIDAGKLRSIASGFGGAAGAVTLFEPSVGRTLEIQRILGLPPVSEQEPRALRNKAAMAETLRGVALVRDEAALRSAVDEAFAEVLPFEVEGTMTSVVEAFGCERGVVVQEYIDGPEFSIEGYASRGRIHVLAITEKWHSGPPLFEELGHMQPPRLTEAEQRAITEYTIEAARAFRLVHCWFHLEVRLRNAMPVTLEINCRLCGDMIGRLLELRSPMNVGDMLLGLAAGETVSPPERLTGAAGVRMAAVPAGGTVKSIRPPLLRSELEFAVFESGPGSSVHPPKPGGVTRLGYFIVAGEDREGVEKRLSELADETRIEVTHGEH